MAALVDDRSTDPGVGGRAGRVGESRGGRPEGCTWGCFVTTPSR